MHSLGRHLLEVEAQREDDAGAAVHAPEEHADAVLGRLGEAAVPEQELPVECPALAPERRVEQPAVRLVPRGHVTLEMMARDHLVKDGGAGEVDVVAAHAHQLRFVGHGVGRKRDDDRSRRPVKKGFTSWRSGDIIVHPPRVAAERGDRDEVVAVEVVDRLERQVADQVPAACRARRGASSRARARRASRRPMPISREAFFISSSHQASSVAGELDQLLGRVGDHLVLELAERAHRGRSGCRRSRSGARRSGRVRTAPAAGVSSRGGPPGPPPPRPPPPAAGPNPAPGAGRRRPVPLAERAGIGVDRLVGGLVRLLRSTR